MIENAFPVVDKYDKFRSFDEGDRSIAIDRGFRWIATV